MKLVWKEKSKKNSKDNGFTLIEVIVSIALLASLSVVLLQMFTVSGKTNRSAYELDTANALCIKAAEMYKDDPRDGKDDSGTYLIETEFTRTVSGSKIIYTKNIDSRFQLEIESTNGGSTTMPISYYPDPAYTYEVPQNSTNIDIVLDLDPSNKVNIVVESSPGEIDSNIIFSESGMPKTAMIPIHLDFSKNDKTPVTVNVENNIGLLPKGLDLSDLYEAIADIYLCDTKESNNVSVVPVSGMSTENKITKKVQRITKYSGEIRIKRLSDGAVLAENSVEDYWVGN